MCVRNTHITYYKKINARVNAGVTLLLHVYVVHTHELHPKKAVLLDLKKNCLEYFENLRELTFCDLHINDNTWIREDLS